MFTSVILSIALVSLLPNAFADSASVSIPVGTSVPGCEETNECFIPAEVTVDVGGEVTWTNDDTAAHTVTSGNAADGGSIGTEFDSGLLLAGSTFSYTFDNAGTIDYFCIVHPWMSGQVNVQGTATEEEEHMEEPQPEPEPLPTPFGTSITIPYGSSVPDTEHFSPDNYYADTGDYVIWFNSDSAAHTVTSGNPSSGPDGKFDSSLLLSGASFDHQFNQAGTYPYFCMVHPWMTAEVIIQGTSSPEPDPEPDPEPLPTPPFGTDVIIPYGTGVPGCEETSSCFSPLAISVDDGDSVTWFNQDNAAHTITSGLASNPSSVGALFDSGLMLSGSTFSHTFNDPGTVEYFCIVHPWMEGFVVVDAISSSTPEPQISPTNDPSQIYSYQISGTPYSVEYRISTGLVSDISTDIAANSLRIQMSALNEGELTITIPRDLLDAKYGTRDDSFFVLENGEEVDFNESANSMTRTLSIPFTSGTSSIEIIGSQIYGEIEPEPIPVPLSIPEPEHTIQTDKNTYNHNEIIYVTGNSSLVNRVQITHQNGDNMISAPSRNSYEYDIDLLSLYNGNNLVESGNYIINAIQDNTVLNSTIVYINVPQPIIEPPIDNGTSTVTQQDPDPEPAPQVTPIVSVSTAESAYEEGDTIVIYGNVTAMLENTPMTIQVFDNSFNLIELGQVIVAQDGNFTYTIIADGPLWQEDGFYTVIATYGSSDKGTSFEYTVANTVVASGQETTNQLFDNLWNAIFQLQTDIVNLQNSYDILTSQIEVINSETSSSAGTLVVTPMSGGGFTVPANDTVAHAGWTCDGKGTAISGEWDTEPGLIVKRMQVQNGGNYASFTIMNPTDTNLTATVWSICAEIES